MSNALTTRILFEGRRAVGVEYRQGDATHVARADGEVIVAGGAFNSPQLLQLSGLGPAALLQSHGIDVIADMPGVGADLQDHLQVRMQYRCTEPITMNDVVQRAGACGSAPGLRYILQRKGLLTIGAGYAGGFFRTDPSAAATPDVQIHLHHLQRRHGGRARCIRSRASSRRSACCGRRAAARAHQVGRSARAARDPAALPVGGRPTAT